MVTVKIRLLNSRTLLFVGTAIATVSVLLGIYGLVISASLSTILGVVAPTGRVFNLELVAQDVFAAFSSLKYAGRIEVILCDGREAPVAVAPGRVAVPGCSSIAEVNLSPARMVFRREIPGLSPRTSMFVRMDTAYVSFLAVCLGLGVGLLTYFFVRRAQARAAEAGRLAIEATVGRLAAQVAHDIRSPLALMSSVIKDNAVPGELSGQLRLAVQRIRDIADDLLLQYRHPSLLKNSGQDVPIPRAAEPVRPVLISEIVDASLVEKRRMYASDGRVQIFADVSFGLFCLVQPIEFGRVISNLIDNSVESLVKSGSVIITAREDLGGVVVSVADSGTGIPAHILARLGKRGETYGKRLGSGLGLYHAKTSVESWGGALRIDSREGAGTTVTMSLPMAPQPDWFLAALPIDPEDTLIVLDDDVSVHHAWKRRVPSVRHVSFSRIDDVLVWYRSNHGVPTGNTFLVDYHIGEDRRSGLDLIEILGVEKESVLVTGDVNDALLERCKQRGVRVLPKALIAHVPITIPRKVSP